MGRRKRSEPLSSGKKTIKRTKIVLSKKELQAFQTFQLSQSFERPLSHTIQENDLWLKKIGLHKMNNDEGTNIPDLERAHEIITK